MRYKIIYQCSLLACLGLGSCIDNSYDLSNIDKTLGTYAEVELPTSSTGAVLLKNIIDLKTEGIIHELPDGTYAVRQTGQATVPPVNIGAINIAKPNIADINVNINLDQLTAPSRHNIIIHGTEINEEYRYTIAQGQARTDIAKVTSGVINNDVISIESVKFQDNTLTVHVNINNIPNVMPKIHTDDMVLSLPKDLSVKSCTYQGNNAVSIQDGVITLIGTDNEGQAVKDGLDIKITFDGAQTGNNLIFDQNSHIASFTGAIEFNGTFRITSDDLDISALTEQQKQRIAQDGNISSLIPENINFQTKAAFQNNMAITNFTGKISHTVGHVDPITLNDIPAFLNNPETILDLSNPAIFVTTSSSMPATLSTSIALSSDTHTTQMQTDDITIVANQKNVFCIAPDPSLVDKPTEYADAQSVVLSDLPQLVTKIPHNINIDIKPINMEVEDLDITQPYNFDVNYEVYAPLTFGDDVNIVYTSTDRDWDIPSDVQKLNTDSITAVALVDNELDAALTISIIPIDSYGMEIPQLTVNSASVPADTNDHPIYLCIKAAPGHTLQDALVGQNGVKQLDGIIFRAQMNDPSGEKTLHNDRKLWVHDIKVSIKGLITYDDK